MENGVRPCLRRHRGAEKTGSRYVAARNAQIKHRTRDMFCRVYFAFDSQDLLRAGNSDVVDGAESKMTKAGAQPCTRGHRQLRAARPPMEVQDELRTPARDCGRARR